MMIFDYENFIEENLTDEEIRELNEKELEELKNAESSGLISPIPTFETTFDLTQEDYEEIKKVLEDTKNFN